MTAAATWLSEKARLNQNQPLLALVLAWVLSMLLLPITRGLFGDAAIPPSVVFSTLLQASAVLLMLANAWGWRRVALVAALVLPAAWAVELIGSQTGVPFGVYDYTSSLQPQVGGVPLLVPLAWLMMLPPAWAVAASITGRRGGAAFVIVSALACTAWDLFLDPQMVAWGFWTWAGPAGYFGIPWSNFAGWLLASALLTLLVRPAALPVRPLLLIYGVGWALESIGQAVFWGLPGPALVGFAVMGGIFALALRRTRKLNESYWSEV